MRLIKRENRTGVFLIILAFCLLLPIAVMAAGPERVSINPMNPENLTVTSGKSMILESQNSIKRFSIAEPKIADVIVLTPKQVYLTGKTPGVTSLTFWGEGDKLSAVFDVEVTPNVASLKDKLHKVFPNEKGIQVTTSQDSIVLTGSVSNAATMAQVLSIAESYSPSGKDKQKLINLMEVGGVQQVMLEVRVSEMSKSLGRKLGVNFSAIGRAGRDGTLSFVSALTSPATIPAGVLAGTKISRDVTWTALVDA
ncbi:MAG: pilus assembly protein CpaC, partial [Deltaproteobacteria bacterium HGW-Deltaproteobacteria-7]